MKKYINPILKLCLLSFLGLSFVAMKGEKYNFLVPLTTFDSFDSIRFSHSNMKSNFRANQILNVNLYSNSKTQPNPIAVNLVESVAIACTGEMTGSITATISGGSVNGQFIYQWSTGTSIGPTVSSTNTISNLGEGLYSVTVTQISPNTCTDDANIILTEPPSPLIAFMVDSIPVCNGNFKGSATVSVSGGTMPYSYDWSSSPSTLPTANNLFAGQHFVTVTDGTQCMKILSVMIDSIGTNITDANGVSCFGGDNGTATVNITGSAGSDFSYSWDSGSMLPTANNLVGGNHFVTISNQDGCIIIDNVFIDQPPELMAIVSDSTNVTCFGLTDGMATANASGGTGGYTYLWNTFQTSQTIGDLGAGHYSITIIDDNGCLDTNSVTIEQPALLVASIDNFSDVSCFEGADGTASVKVEGGNGGFTYVWTNGGSSSTIGGLVEGTYVVTVTDALDCTDTTTIFIMEPLEILATVNVLNEIPCDGVGLGILSVDASGGTPPYTYLWDDDQTTISVEHDEPNTYSVTVTDQKGCEAMGMDSLTLSTPPQIIEYESTVVLQDNVARGLVYNIDQGDATLVWEIIELENLNIDMDHPDYSQNDESPDSIINLTLALEKIRTKGFVRMEVYPKKNQCEGEIVSVDINVYPDSRVFAPEIFSPDNDGFWEVSVDNPDNYSIKIFSRSGQKVFEAKTLTQLWDGAGCPDGPYYYVIRNTETNDIVRGAVSILR